MALVRGGALPPEAHLQRLAVVTEIVDSDEMIQELRQRAHPDEAGRRFVQQLHSLEVAPA